MTGRRGFSCTAPYQPFAGITDPAGITRKKEDLLQHLPRVYCRHNPEYRAWFQLGLCLFLFRMPEKRYLPHPKILQPGHFLSLQFTRLTR
jgi:hypothetical protein